MHSLIARLLKGNRPADFLKCGGWGYLKTPPRSTVNQCALPEPHSKTQLSPQTSHSLWRPFCSFWREFAHCHHVLPATVFFCTSPSCVHFFPCFALAWPWRHVTCPLLLAKCMSLWLKVSCWYLLPPFQLHCCIERILSCVPLTVPKHELTSSLG